MSFYWYATANIDSLHFSSLRKLACHNRKNVHRIPNHNILPEMFAYSNDFGDFCTTGLFAANKRLQF